MLKRFLWLAVATVFFAFQVCTQSAQASELDAATRTVAKDANGGTVTLSLKQVKEGKRLFQYACAQCHVGGVTKTDPNVGLDPEALSLATPARNNIDALVDYMKVPTSYDGATDISEVHPSLKSKDTFPEMRNLTEQDLVAIAGHILLQPKVVGDKWGGGKIYY
ncbi:MULTISPECIES: photosystem II cytochrome c-550 [Leptolyngbya]|jgi:photosystem II cytochrome c550|uniref:Photosystem II extrinsic protein V n=2 Tax=Leptolyngbya boryana TaxID=1184 RepID=A0A1Z4JQZ4_LEPBY|nr:MULTISPECIES: photosystem II cytochrome c-550 [Leptolyngbya]BAY59087.1 PsbV protein [Leptolyngbya boryana NIES-2135]MBD1857066.1 cytochrome c-550 [Leptolyngbya sp. FACHB-1624]MBD2368166.1 cytochrome c-550 [Leptolyngbya sp. FACHB-161]MBD2374797.1 cytochrome c-550 [Leptolyngbya sp. FACHB-238]MBD2399219.1 cytochrome c-550 [Leptolyngbya sp. FACHB-239]